MTRFLLLALVACGSDKPSEEAVNAYHAAQRAALDRVAKMETAFSATLRDLEAGKWVPRADLGACTTDLPSPPKGERWFLYPAWFLGRSDDTVGWDRATSRVFDDAHMHIGDPDKPYVPDKGQIEKTTAELAAFVPFKTDVMIVHVDDEHEPRVTNGLNFDSGFQRGRAWVWSTKQQTIICAGVFAATTPEKVDATVYGHENTTSDLQAAVTIALGHESTRAAVKGLTAAGPPK